eukprot:14743630-Alexandrium_andersonii.AAC.1
MALAADAVPGARAPPHIGKERRLVEDVEQRAAPRSAAPSDHELALQLQGAGHRLSLIHI